MNVSGRRKKSEKRTELIFSLLFPLALCDKGPEGKVLQVGFEMEKVLL